MTTAQMVSPLAAAALAFAVPLVLPAQKPSKVDTTIFAAADFDGTSGLQDGQRSTTPIRPGQTIRSSLDSRDHALGTGPYYEPYSVNVSRGQVVFVTMRSRAFDAVLQGRDPHNRSRFDNDDFESESTDARFMIRAEVPSQFLVVATALEEGMVGAYSLEVSFAGRTVGTNPGQRVGTGSPIAVGQTIQGQLGFSDPVLSDESFYEQFIFSGAAGDRIVVTMRSAAFDTFLKVVDSADRELASNDDFVAGSSDSQVTFTVPSTGRVSIIANSFEPSVTGSYTLTLERARQ